MCSFPLCLIFYLLLSTIAVSQTTITVGSGTNASYYVPFNNFYNYSYNEEIYTANELNHTAGCITKIAFYCQNSTSYALIADIYLGTTSRSQHNNNYDWTPAQNLTQVVSNRTINFSSSTYGWVTISLDTPFPYNGIDNLVVVVSKKPTQNYTYTSSLTFQYHSKNSSTLYRQNDSYSYYCQHPGTSTGTLSDYRANIKITFDNGANCPRSIQGHDTVNCCGDYLWNGVVYTRTGTYQAHLQTADGEDSTAYLHLTVTKPNFEIQTIDIPELCAGENDILTIGYNQDKDIHLHAGTYALTVTDTIFLPDGIYCEPYGCSYRSPVTFTDFRPGSYIRNSNDIFYVRLKLEHSFVGDLHINLTCPNGNRADILNYGGSGSSSCSSSIPQSSRGWQSGSNASGGTFFGIANESDYSSDKCNSYQNPPGIGWNYCWSNNTSQGYRYASGSTTPSSSDLVYRSSHSQGYSFDSSNVASKTNFYIPDDNFSSLIGCPLNGDWYIEVMDGWSADNGYLFEWELVLNPELLPPLTPNIVSTDIDGPFVSRIGDSSFYLDPPIDLENDTVALYHISVTDDYGCTRNSIATSAFHPVYNETDTVIICRNQLPYRWRDTTFLQNSTSGEYLFSRRTAHGCDSIVRLTFIIQETQTVTETVEACHHYTWHGQTYYSSTTTPVYNGTTTAGCDSTVHLHLTIVNNIDSDTTATACDTFTWNGTSYTASTNQPQKTIHLSNGCDSIVHLHLTINHSTSATVQETVCDSLTWHGTTYTASTNTPTYRTTNAEGCDSTTRLNLTVNHSSASTTDTTVCDSFRWHGTTYTASTNTPTHHTTNTVGCDSTEHLHLTVNHSTSATVQETVCDSLTWHGTTYTASTHTATFRTTNAEGCDSTTRLNLTVFRSAKTTTYDTICDNASITFCGQTYTQGGTYTHHLSTSHGCDSTAILQLTISPTTHSSITDTIVENQLPWNFNGVSFSRATRNTAITIQNAKGCDSIINYTLIIHYNYHTTVDTTVCSNMLPIVWDGVTFSEPGTQTVTLESATHSDSIVTMTLFTVPAYDNHFFDTICDNESVAFSDTSYNTPGHFTHIKTTIDGCDSVSTLHLTVNPTYHTHLFDTICSNHSIQFADSAYSTTGTYTKQFLSIAHCDSTATLHLTVHQVTYSDYYDTVVQNQLPHPFNGQTFNDSVSHTNVTIANTHHCDSIINYSLYVHWNVFTQIDTTICDSQLPLVWNRLTFVADAAHIGHTYSLQQNDTLTAHTGADSILTQTVVVHPSFDIHLYDTIYQDETYTFEGNTYNTSGTYPIPFHTQAQCDSIRTLHLQVNQRQYVDSSICQNQLPFEWNHVVFTAAGTDSARLSGVGNIDSLVVMTLSVRDTHTTWIYAQACNSYEWELNHETYTRSTESPTVSYTNSLGCDSVVHLHLTINYDTTTIDHIESCNPIVWIDGNTYEGNIYGPSVLLSSTAGCDSTVLLDLRITAPTYEERTDTFCNGYTFIFEGKVLSSGGTYFDTLKTVDNCDSIIRLLLIELPSPQIAIDSSIDCILPYYTLSAVTNLPYLKWTSFPDDVQLEGHENNSTIVVNPHTLTTYSIYADYGTTPICPVTAHIDLSPIVQPHADFSITPPHITWENDHVTASDKSTGYTRLDWFINNAYTSSDPIIRFYDNPSIPEDTLWFTLVASNENCQDTSTKPVAIHKPTLFIPNIFTPGLEGENRLFAIKGKEIVQFHIYIYSREGLLVFESGNIDNSWDGTYRGEKCPQGTYTYIIRYSESSMSRAEHTKSGTVLLVR